MTKTYVRLSTGVVVIKEERIDVAGAVLATYKSAAEGEEAGEKDYAAFRSDLDSGEYVRRVQDAGAPKKKTMRKK